MSDAADFESYTFQKVDLTNSEVKSSFEDYIVSFIIVVVIRLFLYELGIKRNKFIINLQL